MDGRVPIMRGTTAESCEKSIQFAWALEELEPGLLMIRDWSTSGYGVKVERIQRFFEEIPGFECFKLETVPTGRSIRRFWWPRDDVCTFLVDRRYNR